MKTLVLLGTGLERGGGIKQNANHVSLMALKERQRGELTVAPALIRLSVVRN